MAIGQVVQVNNQGVVIAVRKLQLNLQRREEMYTAMGSAMLVSIRRTFREQGSPTGSWVPLSPRTIARNPKKYGSGHKLLIDRGVLLNSITFQVTSHGVAIGTNLAYAAVHQYGSKDRGGYTGAYSVPMNEPAKVKGHYRTVRLAPRYEMREVKSYSGKTVKVPMKVFKETVTIKNAKGRNQKVTRNIADLGVTKTGRVRPHGRFQNIPARPYLVFRPEDPARLYHLRRGLELRTRVDG